jgi:hypothetical protein
MLLVADDGFTKEDIYQQFIEHAGHGTVAPGFPLSPSHIFCIGGEEENPRQFMAVGVTKQNNKINSFFCTPKPKEVVIDMEEKDGEDGPPFHASPVLHASTPPPNQSTEPPKKRRRVGTNTVPPTCSVSPDLHFQHKVQIHEYDFLSVLYLFISDDLY